MGDGRDNNGGKLKQDATALATCVNEWDVIVLARATGYPHRDHAPLLLGHTASDAVITSSNGVSSIHTWSV
jgi:hypothetical protein